MKFNTNKQAVVWGGLLILFGLLSLIETYFRLSAWVWIVVLAAAGFGVFWLYTTDRSDRWLLIPAYVLWAVAGLILIATLDIFQGELIATYVLVAIALPFLDVYRRDRNQWWALIPAYSLLAVGLMVFLIGVGVLDDYLIAVYVMLAIAIPFFFVYFRNRNNWWALIPTYSVVAVGLMVFLIGVGVLDDILVAAYVMFAIAIAFFFVYFRNRSHWWALIPGGIMAVLGISFLISGDAAEFIAPLALVIAGGWIIFRQLTRKEAVKLDTKEPASSEEEAGAE
jgi:hypothetical protein